MRRRIRQLRATDVDTVMAIDTWAHGETWSRRTFDEEIERGDRHHLVAVQDHTIVGHASMWLDGPSGRVTNVAVADGHGGNGHASAMLLALLGDAVASGTISNVQLEVRPSNRRAQRLYGRFGFVPVGIERDLYGRADAQGSRDGLVMAVVDVCDPRWRARFEQLEREHDQGEAA